MGVMCEPYGASKGFPGSILTETSCGSRGDIQSTQ